MDERRDDGAEREREAAPPGAGPAVVRRFQDAAGGAAWVDVAGLPDAAQEMEIAALLGIERETLQRAWSRGTFPRFHARGDTLFLRLRIAPEGREDRHDRLLAWLRPGLLVTWHPRPLPWLRGAEERLAKGPAFVLDEVIDRLLEREFMRFEAWRQRLDRVESMLLGRRRAAAFRELVAARQELLRLSQGVELQHEAVAKLARVEPPLVPPEAGARFAELAERAAHSAAFAAHARDSVQHLFDLHTALDSQRANAIMQRLTVVTAVFLPLTLITGIYGMNFDWMPELHWHWGYPAVLLFMASLGTGLFVYFRRTGWFRED
ncbi:MAG: magnesium transporter CorA family protein [Firmicutes bacterium]|nr:magnesium transporter CorA family protein [Bacillota bacterium]